jgi:hypothetical protein
MKSIVKLLIKHYFCSQFYNYMYTCYLEIIKWTKILGQENKQDWIHFLFLDETRKVKDKLKSKCTIYQRVFLLIFTWKVKGNIFGYLYTNQTYIFSSYEIAEFRIQELFERLFKEKWSFSWDTQVSTHCLSFPRYLHKKMWTNPLSVYVYIIYIYQWMSVQFFYTFLTKNSDYNLFVIN